MNTPIGQQLAATADRITAQTKILTERWREINGAESDNHDESETKTNPPGIINQKDKSDDTGNKRTE